MVTTKNFPLCEFGRYCVRFFQEAGGLISIKVGQRPFNGGGWLRDGPKVRCRKEKVVLYLGVCISMVA